MKYLYYRISGGVILIIVGLIIWLSNLEVLHIAWRRDWPVVLIVVGILSLIKHVVGKKHRS